MEINLNDPNKCIIVVTPGTPLHVGGVDLPRAVAECSRHGVIIGGATALVFEYAMDHEKENR